MWSRKGLLLIGLVTLADFAAAALSPWVDFEIVRGFVVIPTAVQGIEGYSIIDTGAQITGIQQSFVDAQQLELTPGPSVEVSGVNGTAMRKVYRNVPAKLMGADLTFKRVIGLDIDPRMQLLIGGEFLRGLYFQFDYPNKRLRAISRDTFDLKKISNVKSRLDPATRQPMAKVRLNDEYDAWLVFDTGSTSGILMKRAPAEKRGWLEQYGTEQVTTKGATTRSEAEIFRLPLLDIGPFQVKNARVLVPLKGDRLNMFNTSQSRSVRRRKTQGLLGYDVLKNFLVTFDYQSGAVFVELPEAADSQ